MKQLRAWVRIELPVERTPWPPAASSVPRAVERSCPEPSHPQHTDIYFPLHTIKTPPSLFVLLVWSGAQNCLQTFSSTTNETLQPKVICPPPHPLPPPPHICVVSARARVLPTFPQRSDDPIGRGPGYTARTARRSLMRRQDVTAFRSPVNPLLTPTPLFAHNHVPPSRGTCPFFYFQITLSASICAHLAPLFTSGPCPIVWESVLPGFPPPDGSGSGRTVLERAASLCAACASCFELPAQSGDAAPAAALRASSGFRSGFPCVCRRCRRCENRCGNLLWLRGERRPSSRNRLRGASSRWWGAATVAAAAADTPPAGKFRGHYSRRTTPPREDLRSVCERLQNSVVNENGLSEEFVRFRKLESWSSGKWFD